MASWKTQAAKVVTAPKTSISIQRFSIQEKSLSTLDSFDMPRPDRNLHVC
jgi:hypothetical protein